MVKLTDTWSLGAWVGTTIQTPKMTGQNAVRAHANNGLLKPFVPPVMPFRKDLFALPVQNTQCPATRGIAWPMTEIPSGRSVLPIESPNPPLDRGGDNGRVRQIGPPPGGLYKIRSNYQDISKNLGIPAATDYRTGMTDCRTSWFARFTRDPESNQATWGATFCPVFF